MNNQFSFTGKTVLVTGASGAIGSECAVVLNRLGAKIILCGRNEEKLEKIASLIKDRNYLIESFDLSNIEAIPNWIKSVSNKVGYLYGVVHAAGISAVLPTRLMKWEKANEMMNVNWGSGWMLAKAFRQRGVYAEDGARLIFISSSSALKGEIAMSAYSASKGALLSMTRSLAVEYAPDKINVNAVVPGFIPTEMNRQYLESLSSEQRANLEKRHPLGLGNVQDVAWAVVYLMSNAAKWITGIVLPVDGGLSAV